MSYALLTSQSGLPVVVSTQSHEYPHLIMAGYSEEAIGHKKDMHDKERELLEEMDIPLLEFKNNRYLIN